MYEKFSGDDIQNKCISEYAVSLMRMLYFLHTTIFGLNTLTNIIASDKELF